MDDVILHLDVLELVGVLMAAFCVAGCLIFAAVFKLVETIQRLRARQRGERTR